MESAISPIKTPIAHVRRKDGVIQSVTEHLLAVGGLSRDFAAKIGLEEAGELLGLLHDLGKYSSQFQNYIRSAIGQIDEGEDDYVDAEEQKGRIDHSTAGAQLIWRELGGKTAFKNFTAQVLALCIASHHSGLIDCLSEQGIDNFTRRMKKNFSKTNFLEAEAAADAVLLERVREILEGESLEISFRQKIQQISKNDAIPGLPPQNNPIVTFKLGMLVRFLFSCLIDGDRLDTAIFESPELKQMRTRPSCVCWTSLISLLDQKLSSFQSRSAVDHERKLISDACLARSGDEKGIFTLTVPTGGGKTLSSLRFALHHAEHHQLDRIIYVVPYTSIIDQNARVVREILEPVESPATIVLEHHSNLTPENQSWRAKILSENWDAPIVFTTMVQFLECLFSGGTRGARRMHQLANSVVIFDEVQSLPLRCSRIFCNAVNFLAETCGSTLVLSTATQPALHDLPPSSTPKGSLALRPNSEIIPDAPSLFRRLKRTEVIDRTRPEGWTFSEIAEFAVQELDSQESVLIIVNTKQSAKEVYQECKALFSGPIYHLSTSMCPAHRRDVFSEVRRHTASEVSREKIICVSTQLIEAGVDIDFGCVIRFLAGLDSVAQASGRCNRHGFREFGPTYLINARKESLARLTDIRIGKDNTERILREMKDHPELFGHDLLSPEAQALYFKYYFHERKGELSYPINKDKLCFETDLLSLLSDNASCPGRPENPGTLRQSFRTAGQAFQALEAPTEGVIVPYGVEGKALIGELSASFEPSRQYLLLRRAQRFSVNLFSKAIQQLKAANALCSIGEDSGIVHLDERYYNDDFGVSLEATGELEPLIC